MAMVHFDKTSLTSGTTETANHVTLTDDLLEKKQHHYINRHFAA